MTHAFEVVAELVAARRAADHLLLGLDFDGTLAPIVPRPEAATLPVAALAALQSQIRRRDTWIAILTGRSLADIKRRVGLEGAYYAGNHGLEIEGPGVHRVHEQAEAARDVVAELSARIARAIAPFPGAQLEDKALTLSVHYRRIDDARAARALRAIVEQECARFPSLRVTHGKKVVEARPDIAWDKGSALRFLRATIAGPDISAPTVFIGDDRTDEDGFREVGDAGFAILVADPPPAHTAARAYLRSTAEVTAFLQRLDA